MSCHMSERAEVEKLDRGRTVNTDVYDRLTPSIGAARPVFLSVLWAHTHTTSTHAHTYTRQADSLSHTHTHGRPLSFSLSLSLSLSISLFCPFTSLFPASPSPSPSPSPSQSPSQSPSPSPSQSQSQSPAPSVGPEWGWQEDTAASRDTTPGSEVRQAHQPWQTGLPTSHHRTKRENPQKGL